MKRIKVAQIGTSANSHGNAVWTGMLRRPDLFEVVGYAFPENEREKFPQQARAFEGFREMTVEEILNDPEIEAVAVETEEIYLTKYALMAARAGKHLHMEKPGGTDWVDFRQLVETLKAGNLVFSLGYMYRFNPRIREILDKAKNGDLGKIHSVEAHMSCLHTRQTRQWLENFPGGMMFFLGCHLIDLIYQLQGEPTAVIPLSCSSGIDGVTAQDQGLALFQYPNGVSFAKTSACELGGYNRRQLVICGEKGTAVLCPLEMFGPDSMYTDAWETADTGWVARWTESRVQYPDRYDRMLENFAQLVRGKENPYSYDYELGLYRLILRACGKEVF